MIRNFPERFGIDSNPKKRNRAQHYSSTAVRPIFSLFRGDNGNLAQHVTVQRSARAEKLRPATKQVCGRIDARARAPHVAGIAITPFFCNLEIIMQHIVVLFCITRRSRSRDRPLFTSQRGSIQLDIENSIEYSIYFSIAFFSTVGHPVKLNININRIFNRVFNIQLK